MPTPDSAYSAFASLLAAQGHSISPAEVHGLLLGRSCAGAGFDADAWLGEVGEALGAPPEDALRQALVGLQEMVKAELTSTEMTVVLLLPGDDAPLDERTRAIGQWSQGFLGGFGVASGDQPLSADAVEVLEDLAEIAQVNGAPEQSEEAETDLMEVVEYLRVAPVLLFTECGKTPPAAEEPPFLH